MPACISGAADWVLNLSAIAQPQQAATTPSPYHHDRQDQAADAGEVGADEQRDDEQERARDQGPNRGRADHAREQHPARGGRGEEAIEPACSMSRARLTPVAAPVKPAPCRRLTGIRKLE